jgi:AraC family transcriptional regulator of adaptative response / DNA-3-methyladenine glycosylase II
MDPWYAELAAAKEYLVGVDPQLKQVFDTVDGTGFELHTVIKAPFPALIGVIIGQKISYRKARTLRQKLYTLLGSNFTPDDILVRIPSGASQLEAPILGPSFGFLDPRTQEIIRAVTIHIVSTGVDINQAEGIRSLGSVPGIGPWTIQATLMSTLLEWDTIPPNDAFIKERLRRLYGSPSYDVTQAWTPFRTLVGWYLWRWF